ncbi:MAG: hypothetical protein GY811_17695, partial [Myxococcales bacterium]|nr:hypothetical protein [Myxococcales bacterium]
GDHHYDTHEAGSTFPQIDPVGILGSLLEITQRERDGPLRGYRAWRLTREGTTTDAIRIGGTGREMPTQLAQSGTIQLAGSHLGPSNLGFESIAGSGVPHAFTLSLDESFRITRSTRPEFQRVHLSGHKGLLLARDSDGGTVLHYAP